MNSLIIQDLSVRYSNKKILSDISTELSSTKMTAVIGANGVGKSTLIKAILGFVKYTGDIQINNKSINHLTPALRSHYISYVSQRSQLQGHFSVEQVVEMGRFRFLGAFGSKDKQHYDIIEQALEALQLLDLRHAIFSELSIGQQQRVLIARAIATGNKILLLDEPTSALDIKQSLALYQHLKDLLEQQYIILMAIHNLNECMQHANAVIAMCEGKIAWHKNIHDIDAIRDLCPIFGVNIHPNKALGFSL